AGIPLPPRSAGFSSAARPPPGGKDLTRDQRGSYIAAPVPAHGRGRAAARGPGRRGGLARRVLLCWVAGSSPGRPAPGAGREENGIERKELPISGAGAQNM